MYTSGILTNLPSDNVETRGSFRWNRILCEHEQMFIPRVPGSRIAQPARARSRGFKLLPRGPSRSCEKKSVRDASVGGNRRINKLKEKVPSRDPLNVPTRHAGDPACDARGRSSDPSGRSGPRLSGHTQARAPCHPKARDRIVNDIERG
jgi:hypothetical protein